MSNIIKTICIWGCRMLSVTFAIAAVIELQKIRIFGLMDLLMSLMVLLFAVVAWGFSYVIKATFEYLEDKQTDND